ncbi:MAG TPA: hypothetical protein VIM40_06180 [Arthrobacter sp.]
MWFGEVDVPRELVDAGRSGELVLFVGAGASIDAPSSLPSFDRLTKDIAARSSRPLKGGRVRARQHVLDHCVVAGISARFVDAAGGVDRIAEDVVSGKGDLRNG